MSDAFRQLQRLCRYDLREATPLERAALSVHTSLRQNPMDPGSAVGVNTSVQIVCYLSGGEIVYANNVGGPTA